jgi:hypothetical protein
MRLHALDCSAGASGVSVSVECPVSGSDLRDELGRRDTSRIAQLVVLLHQVSDGEQRSFVTIICEP